MPPVSSPPTTPSPSSRLPTDRVEDRTGLGAEELRVEEDVADPATDDRARDDAEDDEQQVVGAEVHRPRADPGQDERREDRGGHAERLPADDAVADVEEGVEVERDDGGRHVAGQCSDRIRGGCGTWSREGAATAERRACQLADTFAVAPMLTAASRCATNMPPRTRFLGGA